MDFDRAIIRALVQSTVALASVNSLKNTILTSEELKKTYSEKFDKNLSFQIKELEELIGEKSLSNIVTSLKEQGLL